MLGSFGSRFKSAFWRLLALKRTPETASSCFRAALLGFVSQFLVVHQARSHYCASDILLSISVRRLSESRRQRNLYVGGSPNS